MSELLKALNKPIKASSSFSNSINDLIQGFTQNSSIFSWVTELKQAHILLF
jgi:hypothetical protein